jgi:hypothetical protein
MQRILHNGIAYSVIEVFGFAVPYPVHKNSSSFKGQ